MAGPYQKRQKVVPPDKGSFPLDHEGICKEPMFSYMLCLEKSEQNTSLCRQEMKAYLDCRINNELMMKEPWSKLGLPEDEVPQPKTENKNYQI